MHADNDSFLDAMRVGARGYLLKCAEREEIAAHLFLSEKIVHNHVATILVKLQVRDRAAAVARARDRGLGDALR